MSARPASMCWFEYRRHIITGHLFSTLYMADFRCKLSRHTHLLSLSNKPLWHLTNALLHSPQTELTLRARNSLAQSYMHSFIFSRAHLFNNINSDAFSHLRLSHPLAESHTDGELGSSSWFTFFCTRLTKYQNYSGHYHVYTSQRKKIMYSIQVIMNSWKIILQHTISWLMSMHQWKEVKQVHV